MGWPRTGTAGGQGGQRLEKGQELERNVAPACDSGSGAPWRPGRRPPRGWGGGVWGPLLALASAFCPPFCVPRGLKQPSFLDKKGGSRGHTHTHTHSWGRPSPGSAPGALPESWTFHLPPPRVPSVPCPTLQPWTLELRREIRSNASPSGRLRRAHSPSSQLPGADKQSLLRPRRAPSSHPDRPWGPSGPEATRNTADADRCEPCDSSASRV